jgi:hypothetical protein
MSDTDEVSVHLDVDSLLSRFGYDDLTIHSVNELIAQQKPALRDFDRDALTWIYHYEPEVGFVAEDPEAPPFDADRYVAEQVEIARYRGDDLEWAALNARGDLDPERFPRFVETMEIAYSDVTQRLSRSASALATVAEYEDAWATAWGRLAELQTSDREEYERRLVVALEAAAAAGGATLRVLFGGLLHMDFLFDDEEPSEPTFDWDMARRIEDDAISGKGLTPEGRLLGIALREAKLPFSDVTPFQYGDGTGEAEQIVEAELASGRLPHHRLAAFEAAKPLPEEPHDPVSDWVGKTVGHMLDRLERLEELLALKTELDPEVVRDAFGTRFAVEQWFASGPVSLKGSAYDQWLASLDPADAPWSSNGLPPNREELTQAIGSWDDLLAFFLQREEQRRRKEIEKTSWWQQPDKYECGGNTRFWKTHLRCMEDAYGDIPELPEREVPYVQCELRRGHRGDHSAFLGEDEMYERWFVSWKDDEDYFAQRLFADLRCDAVDGSPVLHRPELVRHCTLVRGHGGDCRFDGRPEPLVSIEDYCDDTDWARLCWIRERMLGTEPTAVRSGRPGSQPKPDVRREVVDDAYLLRDLEGRVADLATSWNDDTLVVTVAPDAAMTFRVVDGNLETTFRRTSTKPGEEFVSPEPLGGSNGSGAVDFAESMVRDAIQDEKDADGPSATEVASVRALAEALTDLKPTLQITEHGAGLAVPFDEMSRIQVSTLDGEFFIDTWFETPEVSGNCDEAEETYPISEIDDVARAVREVLREMPTFKQEFIESLEEMHAVGDLSAADLAAASARLLS